MTAEPASLDPQAMLRRSGLRPTRQRAALADLMFGAGHRHFSAEMLHEEATRLDVGVSLATVYNTLHQFTRAGLLKAVSVDSARTWFDTNTSEHHHFLVEGEDIVLDVPASSIRVSDLPDAPDGMEIERVDVIVRLRRKG